ncbi:MAG: 50S ribosomal protein L19 [Candidatus Andersenbacteria bacterium]|nr:50S ribosomal protein L19 [Candidatus Andersenbacteria bacterium]
MDLLRHFEQQMRTIERPYLQPGDVVRVEMKVQESGKTRLQAFEGTILGIRGSGPSATMTVRRETGHFGVERIFPLYSPLIEKIDIIKRQKVRRAKLTYLRQAGRRRFKEDVKAMQRHIKEEEDRKRLKEAAEKKRIEEAEAKQQELEQAKKIADVEDLPAAAGAAEQTPA